MKKIQILLTLTFIAVALLVGSCNKKADVPADAANYDPKLTVNATLLDIKKLYNNAAPVQITTDLVVSGIVTGDDKSGSLYKSIVIQDSTTGMSVLIEKNGLFNEYPVGRKVYLKCKGLYVGTYHKYIQMGFAVDALGAINGIPSNLVSSYVVKANYPNELPVTVITVAALKAGLADIALNGKLVTINKAEFTTADAGVPYAQPSYLASFTNRVLTDCGGGVIDVHNTPFMTFYNTPTPTGNGTFRGIFTRYDGFAQLTVIDSADLKMTGTRCNGSVITPATGITIDSLRNMYTGSDTAKSVTVGNVAIHGVVTSNLKDSNISKFNLILQDESGKGIVVYYGSSSYTYVQGDSLTIDLTGATLKYYRGSLEVTATTGKTKLESTGKTVVPQLVTIAQLNADFANNNWGQRQYESSLVKISGCTIGGTPTTYSGSKTITDASAGSLFLYTSFAASFAGASCPTGVVSITGISTVYGKYFVQNTNQIQIRKTSDIQ
jgi:Family of unknown function (DUF5689)